MSIVLHHNASRGFRAQIEQVFGANVVTIVDEADDPGAALVDATVLLHVLTPVTPEMIAAAPHLKLIQKLGVGVNTIALDAAGEHGVAVCNMPGTNSQAVAEMALALMFAVLRRTPHLDRLTRAAQRWAPAPVILDSVGEIGGKTVGLIGYGNSARRLAAPLDALGATILYTARGRHDESPHEHVDLPTLLARADIVSLHVPLTDETRGMIDAEALATMKSDAVLINVARGELIDEPALAAALRSGRLRGAGLDVFASEPLAPDNPLLALANTVCSPHVAWQTPETLERSLTVAHENSRRVAEGAPLLHQVV